MSLKNKLENKAYRRILREKFKGNKRDRIAGQRTVNMNNLERYDSTNPVKN
jgi:hypothetical protein